MTSTFDDNARSQERKDRSRLRKSLANTVPLIIAGSMAITMNATGPVVSADARPVDKTRATPSELGKSIRDAFTAAARAATGSHSATVSASEMEVAAVAPSTYVVAAGDTVSSIAGRYGLATASVLALNGLGWKSVIFAGQHLKLTSAGAIPAVKPIAAASASSRYSIVTGDTIAGIAKRFGVSTQNLLSANGLGWSSIIYPGHTLAIPSSTALASAPGAMTLVSSTTPLAAPAAKATATKTPATKAPAAQATPAVSAPPVSYVIAKGDTIASIATRFGVSSQAILTANGLTWSSIIYSGHSIVIPSVVALTPEMAANARTIVSVGRSLGVPDYGLVVALAAAAQESGLQNLPYGDRDSIGLFQQRPSTGWGTPAQLLNTSYAARLFFGGPTNPNKGNTRGLLDIAGWQSQSVTQAAQSVQLSGFPNAYAHWETSARAWLATIR